MEDKVFVSIFATYMDLWVEDRKAHGFQCKSAIGNLRQIDMYIASNPPQGSIDQSYYEGWLDSVRVPETSTKAVYSKACNRVWVEEREVDLTETEYKILRMLMQNPERIFSVEMIYETVWGEPYYYTSNGTVMVHIRNLRTKIEADPQNPKRVCTVWGKGYRFVSEEQV